MGLLVWWRGRQRPGKPNQRTNVLQNGLLVLDGQHVLPSRHVRTRFALRDRAQQFLVRFGRGRCGDEIARSRRKKRGSDSVAFPGCAMTLQAMFVIEALPVVKSVGRLGEQQSGPTAAEQEGEEQDVGDRKAAPFGPGHRLTTRCLAPRSIRRLPFGRRDHQTNHDRSRRCRRLQDLAAKVRTIVFRERRGGAVTAELHSLAQGIEKHFTIWTVAEMGANFLAYDAGQFVVQVGRKAFEHLDAVAFPVTLVRGGFAGPWICAYAVGHSDASS